jgi:hypothetical protein
LSLSMHSYRMLFIDLRRAESAFWALSGGVEVCFRAESAEKALKVVSWSFCAC